MRHRQALDRRGRGTIKIGSEMVKVYDVIVIGAGHAGCEAALAAARMGCDTWS